MTLFQITGLALLIIMVIIIGTIIARILATFQDVDKLKSAVDKWEGAIDTIGTTAAYNNDNCNRIVEKITNIENSGFERIARLEAVVGLLLEEKGVELAAKPARFVLNSTAKDEPT